MDAISTSVHAFLEASSADATNADRDRHAGEIATLLEAGPATLLTVIEALGPILTNEDPVIRARGIELLTSVVKRVSIPNRTIPNLTQFYLSRLHDHQSVPALLEGLEAILRSDKITKVQAVSIPVQILENFNVQSYNQPVRNRVFQIVQYALDKYTPELAKQPQFVPGFITALEGEKDPRNLLIGFKITRHIISAFETDHYVEDLFDMLFSYFPITFRPPPDDVIGITAEDLKDSLKECFRTTSAFAPYAMPALVEKLGTSSGGAKRDAVELISACAPVYGIAAVSPHIENIWELLKDDVEKAQEDSPEQRNALFCVKSILSTLSSSPAQTNANPLERMLKMIVGDCLSHMKEPESKLARTGGRLIVALASSSDSAFSYATQTALPVILKLVSTEPEPKRKKIYLEILGDLAGAGIPLYKGQEELGNPLAQFREGITISLAKSLREDVDEHASAVPAAKAVCNMIESGLLDNHARLSFYSLLHDALLHSNDSKVREECLAAVLALSAHDSDLVSQRTFPLLLDAISTSSEDLAWPLQCVKEVTLRHPDSASEIVKTLVGNIGTARQKLDSGSVADDEDIEQMLATLLAIIEGVVTSDEKTASDFATSLIALAVFPLWAECFRSATVKSNSDAAFAKASLPAVSNITSAVVRALAVGEQDAMLVPTFKAFVEGDASVLGISGKILPISHASPAEVTMLSVLFASVIISLRKEAKLPVSDRAVFLESLFKEGSLAQSPLLTISLAKCLASLASKLYDDEPVKALISGEAEQIIGQLRDSKGSEIERRRLTILLVWIVRATVVRSLAVFVNQIVQLLSDSVVGPQIAEAFGIFISDKELAISKTNHAVIKPLYKQKLFNLALPLLVSGCSGYSPAKANYLVALSYLLADAPQALLATHLPKVFPLLLESLAVPNAQLKLLAVGFLQTIAVQSTSTFADHSSSAVPKLTALLEPSSSNTESVRAAALRALASVAQSVPYEHLHPLKPAVLRALNKASDDGRKAIRKEATVTRARWTNLSQ